MPRRSGSLALGFAITLVGCAGDEGGLAQRPRADVVELVDDGVLTTRAALQGDPTQPQCGFTIVEPPAGVPTNACLHGPSVTTNYGPEQFTRTTGVPDEFSASFAVPDTGGTCLKVTSDGVAAAWIEIDDEEILSPDDFNPNVPYLTAGLALEAGAHDLDVKLASKPGSSITVEIRFAPNATPQAELILGDEGLVGLSSVFDDPDPFSPAGTDGLSTTTTMGVTGAALKTPGVSSGKYHFLLRAYFEVADASLCGPVVTLFSEASVEDSADAPLTAVWDGRDGEGALVGEGAYYYRAAVELVRQRIADGNEEILDLAISEIQTVHIGDPFGLEGKTTRELNALIAPIKESVEDYYDLDVGQRVFFDALVRARAARRSQLPVEERFMPVPHHSGPRYFHLRAARPVFRKQHQPVYSGVPTPAGYFKIFMTANEQGMAQAIFPPNPAMVVVDESTGETRYNDDCSLHIGATPETACVIFPESAEGPFTIVVFATPEQSLQFGRTDIVVNWQTLYEGVEFGGHFITLAGLPDEGTYAFQTVQIPNGSDDPRLFLFDSDYNLRAIDDDSGVEEDAYFTATKHPGDRLLVSAWAPSTVGYVDVVINDCLGHPDASDCACSGALDHDGDNLSDALEVELGTDIDDQDSDDDGIFDYYEAIGRRMGSPGRELALRRLGAEPLARDIFIEHDREDGQVYTDPNTGLPTWLAAVDPAPQHEMEQMQEVWADLPRLPPDPAGSPGYALHLDTGQPCTPGSTLCGDWGGANLLRYSSIDSPGNAWIHNHMAPVRQGIFRYTYIDIIPPDVPLAGKASGRTATYFRSTLLLLFHNPHNWNRGIIAAHEMGHQLGLGHGGPKMPPEERVELNHKVNYPSVMNYAYQNNLPGFLHPRFSEGLFAELDHRALDEVSYSPEATKTHFPAHPFFYRLGGTSGAVDFNRDGRYNYGVRADLSEVEDAYAGKGWVDVLSAQTIKDDLPTGGGALAVEPVGATDWWARVWAYAPFLQNDGLVYPSVSVANTHAVGETAEWYPWVPLPAFDGHPNGEASAITFDFDGLGRRILVLFPYAERNPDGSYVDTSAGGMLWYYLHEPGTSLAGSWAPVPTWPLGKRARHATVAIVDGKVAMMFRDMSTGSNDQVWMATLDAHLDWSDWVLQQDVPSYYTPGLVEAPDGRQYLAIVNPAQPAQLIFRCRSAGSALGEPWTTADCVIPSENTGIIGGTNRIVEEDKRGRIGLLFLPYLGASGAPFADGSGYLAAFWSTARGPNVDLYYPTRAYTQGYIRADGASFLADPGRWRAQKQTARPNPLDSVAVASRYGSALLMYPSVEYEKDHGPPYPRAPIAYFAFANNIAPYPSAPYDDFDDAGWIHVNTCSTLWKGSDLPECSRCDVDLRIGQRVPSYPSEEIECVGLIED